MINDLRSALDLLALRGELDVISEPTDQYVEVARRFRPGAGVPAPGPTVPGPAMLFERVRPTDLPLAMGVFGTRDRCAALMGTNIGELHGHLLHAVNHPLSPRLGDVHRETRRTSLYDVPILTTTSEDAGPYITMGLVVARDPERGSRNASVHRMCVQSDTTLTIWIVPGRDLGRMVEKSHARGTPLPVAIHIGLDPALYIASCITGRLAPPGVDEVGIAGAIRGHPMELCKAESIDLPVLAHADWVIEGELLANHLPENSRCPSGSSMPEFLGYQGAAHPGLPIINVTAVTSNDAPIAQAVLGPGYEQSNLLGIALELDLLEEYRGAGLWCVDTVYCSSAGGGQLLAFVRGTIDSESTRKRLIQVSTELLTERRMLKIIVLLSEDTDPTNHEEVWWAVTTRMQADSDIVVVPDALGFALDPTQRPEYSAAISRRGRTAKMVIDCTVPAQLRQLFTRPGF